VEGPDLDARVAVPAGLRGRVVRPGTARTAGRTAACDVRNVPAGGSLLRPGRADGRTAGLLEKEEKNPRKKEKRSNLNRTHHGEASRFRPDT